LPSAAKAAIDFAVLTARLNRLRKNSTKPQKAHLRLAVPSERPVLLNHPTLILKKVLTFLLALQQRILSAYAFSMI
jgi:hypothetical protein